MGIFTIKLEIAMWSLCNAHKGHLFVFSSEWIREQLSYFWFNVLFTCCFIFVWKSYSRSISVLQCFICVTHSVKMKFRFFFWTIKSCYNSQLKWKSYWDVCKNSSEKWFKTHGENGKVFENKHKRKFIGFVVNEIVM